MICGKNLGETFGVAFGLLKHGELIAVDRLVLMHATLNVPTSEIAAIGARKRTSSEATNRRTLPVAIVNVAGIEGRLFSARMFKGSANGAFPGGFGDVVTGA
jgi:hypothetical protein